jgi:segregation and condensation protein B
VTDETEVQQDHNEVARGVAHAESSEVTIDVTDHDEVVADLRDAAVESVAPVTQSAVNDETTSELDELAGSEAVDDAVVEDVPRRLVGGDGPTLAAALEALLMVSDQPTSAVEIATLLDVPTDDVEAALVSLSEQYLSERRGFELRTIDGGWRYFSARQCSEVISKYATDGRSAKLTQAALETLAVVAYKQPVSRARIGAIRGVNVDGVMRTLVTRGLVCELEHDPATGAVLYGTTGFFLERMGLTSLNDLPPIEDHLPDLAALDELIEPNV